MRLPDKRLPYKRIITALKSAARKQGGYSVTRFQTRRYKDSQYGMYRFFTTKKFPKRPIVCVIAGFHGEEPAGPTMLATYAQEIFQAAQELKLNLHLVPCANPWGYDRNIRATPHSPFTNGGYCGPEALPKEFVPLRKELKKLKAHAYIDHHEDDDVRGCYIFLQNGSPELAKQVMKVMTKRIPLEQEMQKEYDAQEIQNGIVFHTHDGSSDDMMSREPQNRFSLVIETPSQTADFETRIQTHREVLHTLLRAAAILKI